MNLPKANVEDQFTLSLQNKLMHAGLYYKIVKFTKFKMAFINLSNPNIKPRNSVQTTVSES
jgi:hypothetical protein